MYATMPHTCKAEVIFHRFTTVSFSSTTFAISADVYHIMVYNLELIPLTWERVKIQVAKPISPKNHFSGFALTVICMSTAFYSLPD